MRCCFIAGFSIFRSLKEHWSGPVDDLFGKLSITLANWDSWIGSSSHSGCVIMTLRMESSIASEFKLVCWRGVLNSFVSIYKTISGSDVTSPALVLTAIGLFEGLMIRQRVDCPYFLRLAVMASRFSLRHKLVLLFFSLDFRLGSHSFVILSFRSFSSLFLYQFSRIFIVREPVFCPY